MVGVENRSVVPLGVLQLASTRVIWACGQDLMAVGGRYVGRVSFLALQTTYSPRRSTYLHE